MSGIPWINISFEYSTYFWDGTSFFLSDRGEDRVQEYMFLYEVEEEIERHYPGHFAVKFASHRDDGAKSRVILWNLHITKSSTFPR